MSEFAEGEPQANEFVLFRAGAEILGVFSTAPAFFFVSFFWASKRKKSVFIVRPGSTFFLEKKVAKKTSAVKKTPKPLFALLIAKNNSPAYRRSQTGFSLKGRRELGFHRLFFQGREHQYMVELKV